MLNLSAVLEAGGSSLRDAVKMNIYLANMDDFGAVNEVYDSFFEGARPVGSFFLFSLMILHHLSWFILFHFILCFLFFMTIMLMR